MKKILLFTTALFMSIIMYSQCPISTAVDFNTVDIHGDSIHLFEILDSGKYVLIDFFFKNCGPCNAVAPKVKQAYEAFGCNNYDVVFMEISYIDNTATCMSWCNTYGIEYPTIGKDQGGNVITSNYQIGAFPTLILIAPNKQIVIQDIYPVNSAQTIINKLTPYGIELHDCPTPLMPPENIVLYIDENITPETGVMISWEDNNNSDVAYNIYRNGNMIAENINASEYNDMDYLEELNSVTGEIEYCVAAVKDDEESEHVCDNIDVNLCLPPINFSAIIILKDGSVSLKWNYYNIGEFANEFKLYRDNQLIDNISIDTTANLYTYEDKSPELVIGNKYMYNLTVEYDDCIASSDTIEATPSSSIFDSDNSVIIYPNPAKDYISISGNNIETIEIFNITGQVIDKVNIINTETTVDVSKYNSGTFFVRITYSDNKIEVKKIIIY